MKNLTTFLIVVLSSTFLFAEDNKQCYSIKNQEAIDCVETLPYPLDENFAFLQRTPVVIPEGFSPNGDGKNDTFEIQNIEQYPDFELKIYNRYGTLLFETDASNYVEFDGIPTKGPLAGDGLLPVGTYYYSLKFNDPDTQDIVSWIYIQY